MEELSDGEPLGRNKMTNLLRPRTPGTVSFHELDEMMCKFPRTMDRKPWTCAMTEVSIHNEVIQHHARDTG